MKFLVDAQLPRRVARWLREAGHDALHTLDLPQGNGASDHQVNQRAEQDGRIVITKDADFVSTHVLRGQPEKLLVISTGNITNAALEVLFVPNVSVIVAAFESASYLELTGTTLILHS